MHLVRIARNRLSDHARKLRPELQFTLIVMTNAACVDAIRPTKRHPLALDLDLGLFGAGHANQDDCTARQVLDHGPLQKTMPYGLGLYLKLHARGNAMNSETRGAVFVFVIFILACAAIFAADHLL